MKDYDPDDPLQRDFDRAAAPRPPRPAWKTALIVIGTVLLVIVGGILLLFGACLLALENGGR